LWSAGKNNPGSTCTPNLRSVAASDTEILRGSQNFKIGHVPQATPTWGVNFWSAGKNNHVHTKSTCTPNLKSVASSDTEILRGSRNFKIGHVRQATPTWGANFWSAGKNSPESTWTPNLKNVASSDTEILRGSRNFEIGHVPQATPTWGPIFGLRARTAQDPRAHQI